MENQEYTDEELEQLEILAGLYFSEEQIAQIMSQENDLSNPQVRMIKGRIEAEVKYWQSVKTSAEAGSPAAQKIWYDRIKDYKISQKLK